MDKQRILASEMKCFGWALGPLEQLAAEGYKYCGEKPSWSKKESCADGYGW